MLAREDAVFGYPEVRLGAVPAMVMTMLRRSVGEKHAFDLVASGRMVNAAEAERIGLVNTMVWTHLPSSLLLMTVPFAPTLPVAVALFLIRESLPRQPDLLLERQAREEILDGR